MNMKKALLAAALLLPGMLLANPHEKQLVNGMRVIVKEDRRAPTVVHMVWYRAGAMDEKDGTSGVAHVLEHMMFKGTKTVKAGEFNKIVAEAGGRDNAFTSLDYTAYFQIVPKAALPRMMALEADRMANLSFKPEDFAAEIKVVMEERRMRTEDNPQSLVHEALNSVAFRAHPYRRPIIGWMDDLENMTWQDALDWYRHWYAPNNAYLLVVGDVDHQKVFRDAERTYGRIKAKPLPVRKLQHEPEQTGIKRVTVKAPAKLPYLSMAWKVPRLRDIDQDRESLRSRCWPACSTVPIRRGCREISCAARRSRSPPAPATTVPCGAKRPSCSSASRPRGEAWRNSKPPCAANWRASATRA